MRSHCINWCIGILQVYFKLIFCVAWHSISRKAESCHDVTFVNNGGSRCCRFGNLWCHLQRQSWHHGDSRFSVYSTSIRRRSWPSIVHKDMTTTNGQLTWKLWNFFAWLLSLCRLLCNHGVGKVLMKYIIMIRRNIYVWTWSHLVVCLWYRVLMAAVIFVDVCVQVCVYT